MAFVARPDELPVTAAVGIFGTGQDAREVFMYFAACLTDQTVFFVTKPEFLDRSSCFGLPVLSLQEAAEQHGSKLVVVVGNSTHKASQIELLREMGIQWRDTGPMFQMRSYFADHQVKEFIDLHIERGGGVSLDVGSNIGVFSSYMAGLFDAVHCFEPSPINMKRLKSNLSAYTSTHCHELALSERPGRETFFVDTHTPAGSSSTFERRAVDQRPDGFQKVDVEVTTVDAFCAERDLRPAFIKIDAEGRDFDVLRGAQAVLAGCKPHLVVEVPGVEMDSEAEQIFQTLRELAEGYRVLNLHTWRDIFETIQQPDDVKTVHRSLECGVINLGCIPR